MTPLWHLPPLPSPSPLTSNAALVEDATTTNNNSNDSNKNKTEAVNIIRPLSHSPPIQTEVVCSQFITSFPYLTTCRCEDCQALKKEQEQNFQSLMFESIRRSKARSNRK